MKRVYKYPLKIDDEQTINMPKGAEILCLQLQYATPNIEGTPTIWSLVDPKESKTEKVTIKMYGTGHTIYDSEQLEYIGTIQVYAGNIVYHVFKVNNQ